MFTIETFSKSLSQPSERREPHLKALLALTGLKPAQIHALARDMIWLDW